MAASTVDFAVTLPLLQVQGEVVHPNVAEVSSTLPMLQVSGELNGGTRHAVDVLSTLPMLRVEGVLANPNWARISTRLPRLRASVRVRAHGEIFNVTGQMRASGNAILCFVGPAGSVVTWAIASGGGALFPMSQYTDEYGRAFCRFEAGGYAGTVTIRVTYGA